MENITLKPVSMSREVGFNRGEVSEQRDESTLARLGKRSVLKVSTQSVHNGSEGYKCAL